MNSKLLKVCAAVMLIAGMGDADAVLYGKEGDTSLEVNMSAKVIARVSVEYPGGKRKDLKFYKDNGTVTDDSDREVEFMVNNIAATPAIIIEPGSNVKYDKGWYVSKNNAQNASDSSAQRRIKFSVLLFDPEGNVKELVGGQKYETTKEDAKISTDEDPYKGKCWKLRVHPDALSESTEAGEYKGSLKIRLEAKS